MDGRSPDAGGTRARPGRALACSSCRQKKLRCDRQQPCRSCMRSKDKRNICSYATAPSLGSRHNTLASRLPDFTRSTPAVDVPPSGAEENITVGSTAEIVHLLPQHSLPSPQEQRNSQSWHTTNWGNVLAANPSVTVSVPTQSEQNLAESDVNQDRVRVRTGFSKLLGDLSNPISAAMIKTRYLSPSGWLYSILLV